MVAVILPDSNRLDMPSGSTAFDVAQAISPGLARKAVAARLDDRLVDLSTVVGDQQHVQIITANDEQPEALEVLRHTTTHVMAQAVRRIYGQKVQYTIGPALMDDFRYGFYYDFDLPEPIGNDDLPRIEQEMNKIVKEKLPVTREDIPVEQARQMMAGLHQQYKVEILNDIGEHNSEAGGNDGTASIYRQGEFADVCRGPHLPDTGRLGAFKLLTTAGAYWRGNASNAMLTRIYGIAYYDKKRLQEHIERLAEAEKRDHRVIGKQLDLFTISPVVGSGMALWMPKGAIVRNELETFMKTELTRRGYQLVYSPHIGKIDLWKTSGHYPYYSDSQFPPMEVDDEQFLLKPMNCPFHIEIYRSRPRSYRDLPIRLAELGTVYRYEQSGELSGLTRVRGFTQDDAHIFCMPDHLEDEIMAAVELTQYTLGKLAFENYRVRLSLSDPTSDKYVGSRELWKQAEGNLRNVVSNLGLNAVEEPGEAAFYGPKLDFVVNDCIGREWQLGTVQVDYSLPERFSLEYIGADNHPHRPVMIHRAPFGSLERFMAILIEHFAGAFPLWLAPVQVAVLPVSDKFNEYASQVVSALRARDIRVELDTSADKIGAKIRRATMDKVPYMTIIGQREQESGQVAVRQRTAGDLGAFDLESFIDRLCAEISDRAVSSADSGDDNNDSSDS